MLHRCRFRNHFSFSEETEVSFVINRQTPDSALHFESPRGVRLSKVLAVVGANASGKTNLLKPLAFLGWFVPRSFTGTEPEKRNPVVSHFFVNDSNCKFDLEFELEGELYRYSLEINPNRVIHESLHRKMKKYFGYVFQRDWSETDLGAKYHIRQKSFGFAVSEAEKVRPNASLISTAAQYNVPLAQAVANYFIQYRFNVQDRGRFQFFARDLTKISEFYDERPKLRSQMSEILSRLDLGLSEVVIESIRFNDQAAEADNETKIAVGIHRNGEQEIRLPFWFESNGTQAVFQLLPFILQALESGGLVIIDELEAHLHSDMISELLELFIDPERNPNNAQIIFTSHNLEVFERLQKEQVVLVEKSPTGFSEAWRLDEMKGVRRDDNLYAKYRAGAYGAVPDLAI